MRTVPLGSDDTVSEFILGTMTFGTQTSPADAHTQLDMAVDAGITWLDTAEMYPVNPIRPETIGRTEEIIGDWIAAGGTGLRIATKHSGEGAHPRDGAPITAESIPVTLEGNLKRLRVDTIDLYQFHWPNRGSFQFRKNWTYVPEGERAAIRQNFADCAGALAREVERGTIRHFGLSNESSWGMMQWNAAAEATGGPPVVGLQNEYSLLARLADTDIAETLVHEGITMLAFSPLAAGILTGKYQDGAVPDGSRRSVNDSLGGRWTDRLHPAVAAYLDLARDHGVDPVHMALAWLRTRPFRCVAIIGASTTDQLAHELAGADVTLSEELVAAIDETHKAHPLPY
ncbi:aldo/keto reductase [uncultured Jannaschia sp.]|uniref:aldo/keto reductase n=1 Tax=uncultured Jannaschia sp. TaxID=293347 RepID=UPI002633EDB7|nr:aldo/keto reductase [uncultured Jannaschia sp.]